MKPQIELDRGRHAAPQLYELLRAQIVSLDLLPGEPLSRVQLSAEFNVSQTPVREALLKLTEERLVDVFPQAATRVSLIDIGFAQETHFLRKAIELEIVRELALSRPPELIADLKALLRRQEILRDTPDLGGFTETDQAFHRRMYRAAGKEALWTLVHSRSGHIDRLRRLHLPASGKLDRIVSDHGRILAAIEAGEPAQAQDSLRAHLSGTLEYVEKIRQAHPQYFTPARRP
ncbi:GntR family transcriptional regulator [Pollutimonas bauzanensis]|uniref:DNA-binding transcriptional regulator, GntR family n=1 Tax=Pollutimonas bauzanensis TaxID=658167 RepID=A0A1M5VB04_9BURK|nr:GntR family transcriptional regulator [Pollutimonas bauzanensis]SHH72462.1 DNA-binding transcriptional regulator, GntR family [Pollutimonas bauzanensis]